MKKTKIIATIGPASINPEIIKRLIQQGVNVFRLNFSHGDHAIHGNSIKTIREQAGKLGISVAILADLQGPKIRTGICAANGPIAVQKSSKVIITSRKKTCTEKLISIDYPHLEREIRPGQLIMINDGAIGLRVDSVDRKARSAACTVLSGGSYSSHKGVNLPNVALRIPSLTVKDRRDLAFILNADVNYIALSFVRSALDVSALRTIVDRKRPELKIIAKIEKPEAAKAIDSILSVSDGIMVARGDLGVETSLFEVPVLQKDLITKANAAGKLVIVATQMLESMIEHSAPTRAESTDVANAIFDGTDAIMLSGETAVGAYPVLAVEMMTHIAESAEQSSYFHTGIIDLSAGGRRSAHAVCEAAAWASRDLGGAPVCVFTLSGDTALYLSKIRNQSRLFAFSPDKNVVNMLSLAWNVTPIHIPFARHMADLMRDAENALLKRKCAKKGDAIVVVSGTTPVRGATNFLRVKKIGEE
ncbi:MAG: pyruvate kinase [Chitinispirillaceae bacterium]